MLVDNPVSPFTFSSTDLSEYLNADLFTPSMPSSSSAASSSSRASSPQSPFQSLLTPPQSSLPTSFPEIYDSPNSNNFFNFLEDEMKLVEPFPTSSAPYDFVGALSTTDMQATFAIDPQLMTMSTPSSNTDETDEEEQEQPDTKAVTIAPIKVGGHGKARKGTVQSGGIVKKSSSPHPLPATSKAVSSTSSKENENMDDDDFPADWRPPPEVYAKMSSKEKRQLRNKISARNFRVRRKGLFISRSSFMLTLTLFSNRVYFYSRT